MDTLGVVMPEVISMILKNLDKADLLNCRLVCHSWDDETLALLKHSKWTQELTIGNIEKYIEFVRSTSAKWVLPFYINFQGGRNAWDIESNNASEDPASEEENDEEEIILHVPNPDPADPDLPIIHPDMNIARIALIKQKKEFLRNLKKFEKSVVNLLNLCGPDCVRSVKVKIDPFHLDLMVEVIQRLLDKLSLQIESLHLHLLENRGLEDVLAVDENLESRTILLPKLKKLSIQGRFRIQSSFLKSFVEKCPNLEELKIGFNIQEVPTENHWLLSPTLRSRIKFLEFEITPEYTFLLKLQELSLLHMPLLHTLNLNKHIPWVLDNPQHPSNVIRNTVMAFSETLENLRVMIKHTGQEFWVYHEHIPVLIPFPELPRLKYLEITRYHPQFPLWGGPPEPEPHPCLFHINSLSFPKLEAIEIEHDLNLALAEGCDPFPNVVSMLLQVEKQDTKNFINPNTLEPEPFVKHMNHLQKMFPKMSKVSINNTFSQGARLGTLKYVMNGLIHSKRAPFIKEIQLQDLDENYLGEAFYRLQNPPVLILRNMSRNGRIDYPTTKYFHEITGIQRNEVKIEVAVNGEIIVGGPSRSTEIQLKALAKLKIVISAMGLHLRRIPAQAIEFHMDALMKGCPCLEEIEVSSTMFGKNKQDREEIIHEFYQKWPKARINVI